MRAICDPELFGITESSLTLSFAVREGERDIDAQARVRVNGELRATSEGVAGTRLVRIENLQPATRHRIAIEADGATPAAVDRHFPDAVETLAAPLARQVASFATLNDLHFGEVRFGGTLLPDGDYGPAAPGYPEVREIDDDVPYWLAMNEDAVADINAAGVDAVVVKGDIADRGRAEQFAVAARTLAGFQAPLHAFLGNHDHYALLDGQVVDGSALLGQPAGSRTLDLGGFRCVILDTVEPGHHHGVVPDERYRWLEAQLAETRERATPTLLFMHHQPVPPEHAGRFPNTIGILPEHSLRLFDLIGRNAQVKAVLIGHTHRNRAHRHAAAGGVPFVEVSCVKDYPGSWAHYRLFEDGSMRQEVRRISSRRALTHSTRCRDFFNGGYRGFALGRLVERSFAIEASSA